MNITEKKSHKLKFKILSPKLCSWDFLIWDFNNINLDWNIRIQGYISSIALPKKKKEVCFSRKYKKSLICLIKIWTHKKIYPKKKNPLERKKKRKTYLVMWYDFGASLSPFSFLSETKASKKATHFSWSGKFLQGEKQWKSEDWMDRVAL